MEQFDVWKVRRFGDGCTEYSRLQRVESHPKRGQYMVTRKNRIWAPCCKGDEVIVRPFLTVTTANNSVGFTAEINLAPLLTDQPNAAQSGDREGANG